MSQCPCRSLSPRCARDGGSLLLTEPPNDFKVPRSAGEDDRPKGTRPSSVLARRRWVSTDPCYAAAMIHDLITAIMVTSAAVLASELLVRIWDYF